MLLDVLANEIILKYARVLNYTELILKPNSIRVWSSGTERDNVTKKILSDTLKCQQD
jgi:hypothetical protein